MPDATDRINPDRLYAPAEVAELDGCCIALIYRRLAEGQYAAVKDGRSTRIPGISILERRARNLVPAKFKRLAKQPSRFDTIRKAAVTARSTVTEYEINDHQESNEKGLPP